MPEILFIDAFGQLQRVQARCGRSLMHVGVDEMVAGMVGDCGGDCSCGSCHAYLSGDAASRLLPPSADEAMMLDAADARRADSRLCCQVLVEESLDGLVVTLPPRRRGGFSDD